MAEQSEEIRRDDGEPDLLGRSVSAGQDPPPVRNAAISSNDPLEPSRMSTKFSLDSGMPRLFRFRRSMYMTTRRSGSSYGSGRSSTALATLKIAVLAPMPSAIVATAATVKTGTSAERAPGEREIAQDHREPRLAKLQPSAALLNRRQRNAPDQVVASSNRITSSRI